METASPNPFVTQNGSDVFRQHHNGASIPSPFPDDDEDFGPETDVDMVDEVCIPSAIAAAKALVHGGGKEPEDDLERQRQQLADFDDPADLDRSRDTPTPPAHEVAGNSNADPLAESGGEESEEEWNYISGKDSAKATTEDTEDMSSHLNPNAAEFYPVTPTRLMLLDDAIISASPVKGEEKSLENIEMPSEREFYRDISQRACDLDMPNGQNSKHGDDYFMRDNFSTLSKSKDYSVSSTFAELGDSSIISFASSFNNSTMNAPEDVPFDALEAVKNLEEDKENVFSDVVHEAFGNGKNDPMTMSVVGISGLENLSEPEDNLVHGTPGEPSVVQTDDVSPLNHQSALDADKELLENEPRSPAVERQLDFSTPEKDQTISSCFETVDREREDDGFITEHRRSPPIDLSFKPMQTFSDTNPFGALQTPTSTTTPMDNFNINCEINGTDSVTPMKSINNRSLFDDVNLSQNTSFISTRPKTPAEATPVPFDELESPTDVPHFENPPFSNNSDLASIEQKTTEKTNNLEDIFTSLKQETVELEVENSKSVHDTVQNLFPEEPDPEFEETSFTTEVSQHKPKDLDTSSEVVVEEAKILQDEKEFEEMSKLDHEISHTELNDVETAHQELNGINTTESDHKIINKAEPLTETRSESELFPEATNKSELLTSTINESEHQAGEQDIDNVETKEMKLELESHITGSGVTPDDLKRLDEGFEVISKEDLMEEISPFQETDHLSVVVNDQNPFVTDENSITNENLQIEDVVLTKESLSPITESINDVVKAIDGFSPLVEEDFVKLEQSSNLSSPLEPEVTKTVSYQTLTPAQEPELTKTECFVTGTEGMYPKSPEILAETISESPQVTKTVEPEPQVFVKSLVEQQLSPSEVLKSEAVPDLANEPESVPALKVSEQLSLKSEPVQSQVVTETLITALEETTEVPSGPMAETPLTADTPPPTPVPAPETDSTNDSQKTDILVAAVAAAGALAACSPSLDKEKKEVPKKPAAAPAKKPADLKASGKTSTMKSPATKPTTAKATSTTSKTAPTGTKPVPAKPAGAVTKPALTPSAPKTTTAKPTSAPLATKKPVTSTTAKPASAPAKPAAAKPAVTATKPAVSAATKTVPKQLPVTKTSLTSLKPASKSTTPTSKPTTPTTPKSPSVVKSPPRSTGVTLATDKKPTANGDVKPIAKKPTTVAAKPTTTTRPATAPPKPAVSAKAPTSTLNKPVGAPLTKTKPTTTTSTKPAAAPAPIKRPTSAPAAKQADKISTTANKAAPNTKPAVNGKTAPPKTLNAVKKTDAKVIGKNSTNKPAPIKKPVEVKVEEEKPVQVQEDNITTTNGYGEHDHSIEENGITKIEELVPQIVENVN